MPTKAKVPGSGMAVAEKLSTMNLSFADVSDLISTIKLPDDKFIGEVMDCEKVPHSLSVNVTVPMLLAAV